MHFGASESLFLFLFLQYRFYFVLETLGFLRPFIRQSSFNDSTDNLRALCLSTLNSLLDDLAVWLRSDRARLTSSAGTRCSTDAVQVYFMGLGRFIIDYCSDIRDIETSGGEIGSKEVSGLV